MKDDWLCVRKSLKISTVQWATKLAPSRSLIVCGTTDGKIRLYDAGMQRRPLFELELGHGKGETGGWTGALDDSPRPVKCSAIANTREGSMWSLFVGNTMGTLREFDLRRLPHCSKSKVCPGREFHRAFARRQLKHFRNYRGIMGSIRAIDTHCDGDALVAVGLGRSAYVFSTRKKLMTEKVYLKQKLGAVLFSSEARKGAPKDEEGDKAGEECEEDQTAACAQEPEGTQEPEGDQVQKGFSDDEEEAKAAAEDSDAGRQTCQAHLEGHAGCAAAGSIRQHTKRRRTISARKITRQRVKSPEAC